MLLSAAAAFLLAVAPSVGAVRLPSFTKKTADRRLEDPTEANPDCKRHEIDFVLVEGDELRGAVEGEIVKMLTKVGIKVNTRALSKEEFNAAEQAGDFHMSFSETWGAPYDPYAYAKGWVAQDEGHFQALAGLEEPDTKDSLFARIDDVLREESTAGQKAKWEQIFDVVHKNAIMLPLWGARIPTVLNHKRLSNWRAGNQQFDYPVHELRVVSGGKAVTIAPGAQTGLFQSVGRLDPHTYRPNEFFSNNWVYEGLVSYGTEGQVLPALASGWSVSDAEEGQEYVFMLRDGVTFHDGAGWDCSVAKLNFDHVLAGGLRTPDWHGWYGLMSQINTWECNDDGDFVITTKDKYFPFLQELSFIRPLRMLSPNSFINGIFTDPYTANSCHAGWGNVTGNEGMQDVACAGITDPIGTGPYSLESRTPVQLDEETTADGEVVFKAFADYWGGAPDIETLKVVRYEDSDAVKAALEDGSLDLVWGSGVLSPDHINDIAASSTNDLSVYHSDDIQNVIILLNSGKPPLDDIEVRKAIVHAIDKKKIIQDNLGGLFKPVDNVFPRDAPYCDVDFFPRWDYDFQKAELLNCPPAPMAVDDEQIFELESKINEVNSQLESKIKDVNEAESKIDEVNSELEGKIKEVDEVESKIKEVNEDNARLTTEKETVQAEKAELEAKIMVMTDELNEKNAVGMASLAGIIEAGLAMLGFIVL